MVKQKRSVSIVVIVALVLQLTGCGTILYPERKGQKSGRIDPAIAILDGIGLLFFLVPGVIAFAFDFNNGTIYLPGTAKSALDEPSVREVAFDPKHATIDSLEKIIQEETGCAVNLNQSNLIIVRVQSKADMLARFERILPELKHNRS